MIDTINGAHSSAIIYSIAETAIEMKWPTVFEDIIDTGKKALDNIKRRWSDGIEDVMAFRSKALCVSVFARLGLAIAQDGLDMCKAP